MSKEINFVNPYNFIPFKEKSDKVPPEEEKVLSGVINYTVLTKTPLFIANTSTDKAFSEKVAFGKNDERIDAGDTTGGDRAKKIAEIKEEHKRYDFFSYNKLGAGSEEFYAPVIPGSEIRGMFRNQYEILTSSCLSGFEDVLLSKRTAEVFKSGLIKKTSAGYELYIAEDCLWRTEGADDQTDIDSWDTLKCYKNKSYIQSKIVEGEKVKFYKLVRRLERGKAKPLARLKKPTNPSADHYTEWLSAPEETGYVLKGEDGPEMKPDRRGKTSQKHCCHIFVATSNRVGKDLDISCLDKVLEVYKNNSDPGGNYAYKEYGIKWKEFKKSDDNLDEFFPVYYSEGTNGIIYLSPASITREVYKNGIKKLIRNLAPCSCKKELCPACSLFGTITGKKEAVASRIRFSDLEMSSEVNDDKDCYDSIVTLNPLSSPKISNTEFYVKRPATDAIFWSFDYYIDKNHKIHPITNPELNGRKFYWHNMKIEKVSESAKVTKLNMTIRPVTKGITFSGQLFFDKVSETELERLIWMLNAGESEKLEDKKYGYKLGAAKPLGLGSIAVSVDDVQLRNIKMNENGITYKIEPYEESVIPDELFESDIVNEFRVMNGFNSVPEDIKITYPVIPGQKEGDEGFEWFTNNHVAVKKNKNIDDKSPNKREYQAFAYYLEALKTGLRYTDKMYKEFYQARIGNGESETSSNEREIKDAVVTGINSRNGNVFIEVDGKNGMIFNSDLDGKTIDKGQRIKVKFIRCKKFPDGNEQSFYKLV